MHYSARHRIARYLLTVLVVASPVLADGGEGKLAPVVDLNPRHNEAASSSLRGCDFIGWDRLPACQKYGENDRLEAYPTIFSQPLRVFLLYRDLLAAGYKTWRFLANDML